MTASDFQSGRRDIPLLGPRSAEVRLVAVSLLALIFLAACADGDSERRFANEPIPTQDLASMPTQPPTRVVDLPQGQVATPVPAELLVSAIGTATHRFAVADGRVWSIPLDGNQAAAVADVDAASLLASEQSPAGDAIALLRSDAGGSAVVSVLGVDGAEQLRVTLSEGSLATPTAGASSGRFRLAWSPDAQHILVTLATGGIHEVSVDGTSRTLLGPSGAPSPKAVAWSPDGGAIAFVDGGSEGLATALYVASTDVLPLDPVVLIRPSLSGARQIADILWVGGEAGIVFSQRSAGDDLSIGGDLFAVSPFGGQPRLIAAAGGASQVGVVGEFAVSADGSTVAYTVLGVVDGRPGFESLWLRQVDGPTEVEVATGQWPSSGSLEWTTAGLTWLGQGSGGFAVEWLQPDGSVTALFAVTGDATPIATPAGSPVASPVATPTS